MTQILGKSRNFTIENGNLVTFHLNFFAVKRVISHVSGSKSGLSLVLNVEQYEYMRGPQNDAGIKVNFAQKSGSWEGPHLFEFEYKEFYGPVGRTDP